MTSRAALIWLFMTSIAPLPLACGSMQMRTAFSRLRGPSKSDSEALRCAPISTIGLSESVVRSSHQAVSSRVSVPCEMMTPATSGLARVRLTSLLKATQRAGSMYPEGTLEMLLTSILAYFATSGTVASRSSPEIAGTGACLTGSIFMAIVPPVAISTTTGCVAATATVEIRKIASNSADFVLECIGFLPFTSSRLYSY